MEDLLSYSLRIAPGLVLISSIFFLLPKKQIIARIFALILGFVLMRDAMTPQGLWSFGLTEPAVWLRFIDDSVVLFVLGATSLAVGWLLLRVKELRKLVRWGDAWSWHPYIVGIGAGILVAAPFLALSLLVPLEDRGGAVAVSLLPALLFMALVGNFLEELIFRGFYQSHLEKYTSSLRAALLSGLTFGAAHVFLASTVTNLGWPLLVFVTLEGLVCAFVYRRYGLIAASLTHGIAIFFLAAGLL